MEKSNNKKRILALIEILRKKSDSVKRLKLDEIISELNKKDIEVNNRKTLYDDFKILNDFGFNVEYDNGYYLLDAPFNLSEIKIILDSINSLKNLDKNFLNDLNNKMYDYVSDNDQKLLERLNYVSKHSDSKLLQHMEDIIESIKNGTSIIVDIKNKVDKEEIFPVFLHRANDYYYFYYHYPNSNKLYHYRFDNVKNIKLTNNKDTINIQRKDIINTIEESSKSFSGGTSDTISIKLLKDDAKLIERFLDDFPSAMHTRDGFSLKININNVFYSKLVAYGSDIVIVNKDIAKKYKEYLKNILSKY